MVECDSEVFWGFVIVFALVGVWVIFVGFASVGILWGVFPGFLFSVFLRCCMF